MLKYMIRFGYPAGIGFPSIKSADPIRGGLALPHHIRVPTFDLSHAYLSWIWCCYTVSIEEIRGFIAGLS